MQEGPIEFFQWLVLQSKCVRFVDQLGRSSLEVDEGRQVVLKAVELHIVHRAGDSGSLLGHLPGTDRRTVVAAHTVEVVHTVEAGYIVAVGHIAVGVAHTAVAGAAGELLLSRSVLTSLHIRPNGSPPYCCCCCG